MNANDTHGSGSLLPVLIDLSQKQVILLAGEESENEILSLLNTLHSCTGHLIVLTPLAPDRLKRLCGDLAIDLKEKPYDREDLYGADVVICASRSQDTRDDVHAACRTLGIRLSILTEPGRSDFILITPKSASSGQDLKKVSIYTDGASRGNPGPGGYGAVLEYRDTGGTLHTRELSQGYESTTNNRMELMAAIAALEALTRPCEVELWSDSKYLTDAFNQHWVDQWARKKWMKTRKEPVKNADLWKRLLEAAHPHRISWNWVKGHNGNPLNERCDALATAAADSPDLIPDPAACV